MIFIKMFFSSGFQYWPQFFQSIFERWPFHYSFSTNMITNLISNIVISNLNKLLLSNLYIKILPLSLSWMIFYPISKSKAAKQWLYISYCLSFICWFQIYPSNFWFFFVAHLEAKWGLLIWSVFSLISMWF